MVEEPHDIRSSHLFLPHHSSDPSFQVHNKHTRTPHNLNSFTFPSYKSGKNSYKTEKPEHFNSSFANCKNLCTYSNDATHYPAFEFVFQIGVLLILVFILFWHLGISYFGWIMDICSTPSEVNYDTLVLVHTWLVVLLMIGICWTTWLMSNEGSKSLRCYQTLWWQSKRDFLTLIRPLLDFN